jgi:ABC-type transport system involved in cytochrome c biogenesis ATPase subunit
MIERLELRRWRSFDHVALDLQPGTTFVVAPNGVGKTSLLLGVTWALFGDLSNVDARSCVRLGESNAEATITLSVGENGTLKVHRTVTAAGKTNVTYTSNDRAIDADTGQAFLAEEFGAPLVVAARLAVIRGSGTDDGELRLQEHLYDAFGVSGLRRAAATAALLLKKAEADRKKLRSESRATLGNREQLDARADKLHGDLADLSLKRAPLAEAVNSALETRQALRTWETYDAAVTQRDAAISELLESALPHELKGRDLNELAGAVADAQAMNQSNAEQAERTLSEARAQALAAESALQLLQGHDPSCPTCARPFHGDELPVAIAAQRDSLRLAEERLEATQADLGRVRAGDQQLGALASEIGRLNRPIPEPPFARPTDDPEAAIAATQEVLRKHDELTGIVTAEREAMVSQLATDDELQVAIAAERVAWRREALAQSAVSTLTRTADRLANDHIGPLSEQLRWQWKALFGEDGLQLRPDGTIVRAAGDRELPWTQLSSGEQLWARLVASLLVLRYSTTLPFAWLDEPLEHLDPRARRIVASELAGTTRTGRPAQMIVTTYEHTLARQLAEDLPNTHVRYINRHDLVVLPRGSGSKPEAELDNTAPTGLGEIA